MYGSRMPFQMTKGYHQSHNVKTKNNWFVAVCATCDLLVSNMILRSMLSGACMYGWPLDIYRQLKQSVLEKLRKEKC